MKNKKKITLFIAIILVCIFTAYGIYGINKAYALAEDDFVVGTNNLNDTQENSAKVGDIIDLPEKGWKRYDDSFSGVTKGYISPGEYSGTRIDEKCYNGSSYQMLEGSIKFKFVGDKLRLIGLIHPSPNYSSNLIVKIDGVNSGTFSNRSTSMKYNSILFEITNLTNGVHEVEIINESTTLYLNIDAIDVSEDGQIISSDGTIKPQSLILDKTFVEIYSGNTEKVYATVLPENATNKKVIWSSSDKTIATVNQDGTISALKPGQVDIIVKTEDGTVSAICKVIVTDQVTEPQPTPGKAILSISLLDGKTKDYDLSMEEVNKFINWYETQGSNTYKFDKNISPYKAVKEYIVHDKITSFEVREYE